MTYEEALRKVASCLRLANSSNANEAALAAAKAQGIMDRFKITAEMLEQEKPKTTPDEPIKNFNQDEVITACAKDKQWTLQLCRAVAHANGCKTYFMDRCGGCATYLIGRPSDVQTTRYLIGLLAAEVRRLGRDCTKGQTERYRRDFRFGVVDAIREKFETQWNKSKMEMRAENPLALVKVDQAIAKVETRLAQVEEWAKANAGLRQVKSSYQARAEARSHGYREGQRIEISRAKAGLA